MAEGDAAAAYLIRGDDPSLVARALGDVVARVLDGRQPDSAVEEHGSGGEDIDVGAVVDALTTPPMLVDLRIVVVRDAGRLAAPDAARIAACLSAPAPGVVLVAAAGGGTIPSGLSGAIQRAGTVVDSAPGSGRARSRWLADQLRQAPVKLDARAAATLGEHLGQDVSRLGGLVDALAAAFGEGAAVDEARLAPFLGGAGAVAPWDLTDAVDAGEVPEALEALDRMLGAGGVHPLAVMGTLHRHLHAMLRLDGSTATTPEEAAELIGARSVFPVRKAFEQGRRLGSARIGRAVVLLADADLDLRGRTGLDDQTVLEVLVARLARLSPPAERAPKRRTAGSGGRRR